MLQLEKYTANDYSLYSQLVFNEQVMKMNLGRVFTGEEAKLFFDMILNCNASNPNAGFYKVLASTGYIGMGALNWNDEYNAAEIEYMLLPQYWNRGYGTELVESLLWLADTSYHGADIIAITDPANEYSQRILRGKGFILVRQYMNDDGEPAVLYKRTI